jgi:hypothetical protein
MRRLIALAMVFCFLFGCASPALIKSNLPGAALYLDGQLKGETPYTYSDRAAGNPYQVACGERDIHQGEIFGGGEGC